MNTLEKINEHTIEQLCNGDHQAFEDVFIAYYGRIKNFINGLLKSEDDAEELTQEIFVKLWINRETIDPGRSFHSFLFTVARNITFNFIKHKLVCENYAADFDYEYSEYESPDEILYAKEISLLIEMAVSRMPAQRQRIYRMSRNEGLSNDEIALSLNISKKTVENQLSLALRELRNIVVGFFFMMFFN
ncbi:MAG: RNA polymerase sigma-70 factor [Tannerella sp.]|nr:RNA polymerase sigma-70 factor [Tannerella sp.]